MSFALGLAVGFAIMSCISGWVASQDHRAWSDIVERYDRLIVKLQKQRKQDPANWWKN